MTEFNTRSFVLSFLKRHIVLSLFLGVMILLVAISGLLPPYFLKYLIDTYLPGYINSEATQNLVLFSILYFLSYFFAGAFEILENYLINLFGQKMIHELRYEMIKKSHRLKANYFTKHGNGEMQSRIMDDVYAIETLFATGIVSLLVSMFKIIGILVSIFVFSWMLGVIILILIPFIYLITRKISKMMLKSNLRNRKCINRQANHISETVNNVKTIQLLDKEDYMEGQYHDLLRQSYRYRKETGVLDAVFSPIIEMIKALLIALVAILVAVSTGSETDFLSLGISVGTFAASMTLISNLFSPIQNIGKEIQTMQEGISGMKRVEEFMNETEINKKDDSFTYERIFEKEREDILVFDHLSFRYDDGDKNIFTDNSFIIRKNEKVTLVGRTGAGKTTLFKLILGLENPTEGKVLLNGYDLSLVPDREKRKIFGYVEQGFQYVKGTIYDQLTLGDSSYTLEEVKKVMKMVYLDSYIEEHIQDGYMAMFDERDFSRGQLQLLSLARALLSNPKILLLDEISANLDSKTENQIIMAISSSSKDRTVISISHRLSDQLGFDRTVEIS